jgi:hypothetical protein
MSDKMSVIDRVLKVKEAEYHLEKARTDVVKNLNEVKASYHTAVFDHAAIRKKIKWLSFLYTTEQFNELQTVTEPAARAHCEELEAELQTASSKVHAIYVELEENKGNLERATEVLQRYVNEHPWEFTALQRWYVDINHPDKGYILLEPVELSSTPKTYTCRQRIPGISDQEGHCKVSRERKGGLCQSRGYEGISRAACSRTTVRAHLLPKRASGKEFASLRVPNSTRFPWDECAGTEGCKTEFPS